MPWTQPKTWADGAILAAQELNEQVRDNLTFLYDALTNPRVGEAASVRIVNNAIIIQTAHVAVRPEEGDEDDLETIAYIEETIPAGYLLFLSAWQDCKIIIRHGTGNIVTPNGMDVDINDQTYALFVYNGLEWALFAIGSADMGKYTYDTNNNGIVDKAEAIDDGTYSTTAEQIANAVSLAHQEKNNEPSAFVCESSGAEDAGKGVLLDSQGKLHESVMPDIDSKIFAMIIGLGG